LLAWASYICASKSANAISVDRFLRPPNWDSLRISCDSRYQVSLEFNIFSKILLRALSREIGRYDAGSVGFFSGLSKGITSAVFHMDGYVLEERMRFKREVK